MKTSWLLAFCLLAGLSGCAFMSNGVVHHSGQTTVHRPRPGAPVRARILITNVGRQFRDMYAGEMLSLNTRLDHANVAIDLIAADDRQICFHIEDYLTMTEALQLVGNPYRKMAMVVETSDGVKLANPERTELNDEKLEVYWVRRGTPETGYQPTEARDDLMHAQVTACFPSQGPVIRPETQWVKLVTSNSNQYVFHFR
jgi:hypothetical protein